LCGGEEHHRDARDGRAIVDVDLARVQTPLELLAAHTQPLARLFIDSLIPLLGLSSRIWLSVRASISSIRHTQRPRAGSLAVSRGSIDQ